MYIYSYPHTSMNNYSMPAQDTKRGAVFANPTCRIGSICADNFASLRSAVSDFKKVHS